MSDIKFCACAVIDLQGFSQHLELGAHDVRTKIGEEAIKRLGTLTDALEIIDKFQKNYSEFYPEVFFKTRINDAIIFNLDLDPIIMPDIGKQIKKGYSGYDLEKKFDLDEFETSEEIKTHIELKYQEATIDLQKFIGLISRVHQYINNKEDESYFPGVKTIIALGQRKPFNKKDGKDDPISANFAFSNSFKADKKLHGSNFFVDNNILQLLSVSNICKNLVQLAIHEKNRTDSTSFALFGKKEDTYKESPPVNINLFRKKFCFRKIEPKYLSPLQLIEPLAKFSEKNESTAKEWFKKDFEFLTNQDLEIDPNENLGVNSPIMTNIPLEDPIKINFQLYTQKESDILEKRHKKLLEYHLRHPHIDV